MTHVKTLYIGRGSFTVSLFARRHRMGWDVWGNESANTAHLETSA